MRDLADLEIDAFLGQAELLAQLQALPAWDEWTRLLTQMRVAVLEEMAQASDPGEFRFLQGAAGALGEVLSRPRRIVEAAADYQRIEEDEKRVLRPDLRSAIGLGVDRDGDL